jgi:hypothetical protein
MVVNLSAEFLHGGLSRVRRDAAGATAASLFVAVPGRWNGLVIAVAAGNLLPAIC